LGPANGGLGEVSKSKWDGLRVSTETIILVHPNQILANHERKIVLNEGGIVQEGDSIASKFINSGVTVWRNTPEIMTSKLSHPNRLAGRVTVDIIDEFGIFPTIPVYGEYVETIGTSGHKSLHPSRTRISR